MEERQTLDEPKIYAQGRHIIAMELEDGGRDGHICEHGEPGGGRGSSCFALEAGNIGSVDEQGTSGVVRRE